jgi:hypothetical protein
LVLLALVGCTSTPPVEIPTTTPTITLTPSPTFTPIPSATPTLIPTLTVEDARAKLLDLLATNGNCNLPCLWGITPGESTPQEARAILIPLSSISDPMATGFDSDSGATFFDYYEGNMMFDTAVSFETNNSVVSHIFFQAREFLHGEPGDASVIKPIYDSETFGERVHPYMLTSILSMQGMPAAVLISTDGGFERGKDVPGFYILLLYPDQGLLVSYTTYRKLVGGNVQGCPANAWVELELYPAGKGEFFSEFISKSQWANLWPALPDNPYWRPIEKATSMSLEKFYQTFSQPTNKCIETPANLWATPEPGGG